MQRTHMISEAQIKPLWHVAITIALCSNLVLGVVRSSVALVAVQFYS